MFRTILSVMMGFAVSTFVGTVDNMHSHKEQFLLLKMLWISLLRK